MTFARIHFTLTSGFRQGLKARFLCGSGWWGLKPYPFRSEFRAARLSYEPSCFNARRMIFELCPKKALWNRSYTPFLTYITVGCP